MAKNKLSDLRDHLFETLEALKDKDNPMPIERAKAICDVSQTIINSAKVEIQALEAIDSCETSEFFEVQRLERRTQADRMLPDTVALRRARHG